MAGIWVQVAFVFGLALTASVIAHRYRLSTALVEIIVGMVAGSILATAGGYSAGAIFLTFLAGAELDPDVFRLKWKEAAAIGVASFLLPAIGCWAAAHSVLGWANSPALLAGIALAATSVAVVHTVMMEYGFNRVEFGKTILAACFITDLGTVVTLGLVFAPFTWKTLLLVTVLAAAFIGLPEITPRAYALFGG
jgi:glutathione-regulated potassium-efflux system ancillary protein KefC